MADKLSVFDFDNTLFYTHDYPRGRMEWFEKTKKQWPHKSWWDQADSINYKVLDIKPYEHVIDSLKTAFRERKHYTILLSGRPVSKGNHMEAAIKKLLKHHSINKFNKILLNQINRLDLDFKITRLNQIAKTFRNVDQFDFYDDKYSYASTFISWGREHFGNRFIYHLV